MGSQRKGRISGREASFPILGHWIGLDCMMTTHLAASTDIWLWLLVAGFVALLILGFAFLIIEFPGLLDCLLYKDMPKEEVHRLTGRRRIKSRVYESSNYENVMRLSRQVSDGVRKISFKRAEADGGNQNKQPSFVRKISRRMRGRTDEENLQQEEEEKEEENGVNEKKEGGFVRKLSNRMRRRTSEDGGQWMGRKSKEGGRRKQREEEGKSLAIMEEGEELPEDKEGDYEEGTERKGSEGLPKEMLEDEEISGTVGERAWTFVRSLSTRTKKASGQSNEAPEIVEERNNLEISIEVSKETEIHEENEFDDRISENEDSGFQETKKVKGWARVRKISSSFRGSKACEPSPKSKKKKSKNIKGVVVPGKSKRRGSDFFKKTSRKGSYVDSEDVDKRRKKGCAGIFPQVEVFGDDTDREGYEGDGEVTGAEEAQGKVYKRALKEVEEEEGRGDRCDTSNRTSIPDLVSCSETTRTTL